ncbi:TPA: recombinase family protein [Enterococcus faecium]
MRVAYIRVSSIDQNEQRQIEEMKKFGAERIFIEKQSGATITHRPVFQEALDYVRDQDIFIVEAIDRLGRNYDEIITSVNYLKKKNVKLIITSLPIMAEAIGNPLLDKFIKDLIIQILAMIAEQERTESKRRQAQGIKIAKANGVYKGRPKLYSADAKDPKLSSFLGRYILKHKFGLPKSLIELQEIVSKESQVYRGWASIGIWS